ncbi:MAG: acyl-CoA thioesterase-2 [Gammaproteobacteria bacterium]|jgi:acyl-CoA thioesterase-2
MTQGLTNLIEILSPKLIADDKFCGQGSFNDGAPGTYGGHFLGQAAAAALATVGDDRAVHSIHAYFLRGGIPGEPIDYDVERVRDGASFSVRKVKASQNERTAFELMASFAVQSEGGEIPAESPPDFMDLPEPESLPTYRELMESHDPIPLPEDWAMRDHGLDMRVVNAPWTANGPSAAGGIRLWIKANGQAPDDPNLHAAMLAYQSDESLADNLLIPFGVTWGSERVFFVSLDHAMWFHRPIDLNEWHFVEQWPIAATRSRGVARGQVWSRDKKLVASFTQEVLMRID